MDIFLIFLNLKVCCVFSLELPHRGNSNEYDEVILMSTQNIPFSTPENIPNLLLWEFFQGTQERVRNSRGKRAISVRAIEVLLYRGFIKYM